MPALRRRREGAVTDQICVTTKAERTSWRLVDLDLMREIRT